LKGEVRIEQMLEDDAVFETGRRVILSPGGDASGGDSKREAEIEFFRRQHGRCVVKLRGIDSISEAEKFIGFEIKIPAEDLPVPKEGWFYTFQLKGCQVFTVGGEFIGIVTDILDAGGAEILKVDRENHETLIPFAQLYMKLIDPDQRRIEVDLPEELRDLNK
jgi:16S rRNA processing protein RimM